jgi:osmoprotectant transport system permease protein
MGELFDWNWIAENADQIGVQFLEHMQLTVIAVIVGLLISFPLGVLAYRNRRAYGPIAGVTGILYTIPSLALFAFLLPFTGLTTTTAEIGLVSYTLLILIRSIVGGLDGVPADVREAGRWATRGSRCCGGSSCRWLCRSSWAVSAWRR